MKIIQQVEYIEGCTAEEFFALVYLDQAFLRRFHSDVNRDDRASVPAWEGNRRSCTFRTPVDAPALLKQLIGADSVVVVEDQLQHRLEDGSIEVASTPVPQVPGAGYFSSVAVLVLRDRDGGGCEADATVTCTATGPYGLVGTIESFMAEAARKSLRQFLHFCRAHVAALQAAGSLPAAVAAAAALPEAEEAATRAVPEEYYDVREAPPELGAAVLEVLAQAVAVMRSIDARLARQEGLAAPAAAVPKRGTGATSAWLPTGVTPQHVMIVSGGALAGGLLALMWAQRKPR